MDRREFLLAGLALPVAMRPALALAAWAHGGRPLVLVTADAEAHVAAVEVSTGRVVRRIPTLPGPRSIESVQETIALVGHTDIGAVTLIDGPSLRVARVLRPFGEPRYTAASPDGRFAYVTDSGRGEVIVIDVKRQRLAGRVDVGGPARHVSVDATGRWLWTALGTKAAEIAVIDLASPAQPRVAARIRPPFLAHDVGFAPDGRRVWVTSGDRGRIAVYATSSRRVLFTLPAGSPPQHVAFGANQAFVTSGDDGTLRVHALTDGRLRRETTVPVGSYNVTRNFQGRVATPSLGRGTLCVADAAGRLLWHERVARAAHDACFVVSG